MNRNDMFVRGRTRDAIVNSRGRVLLYLTIISLQMIKEQGRRNLNQIQRKTEKVGISSEDTRAIVEYRKG